MTDGGAAFHPGQEEPSYRPRSAYVGHEVFGHGDGAVLVEPEVARDLRDAAEEARVERRITGGLLYGRGWADDEGGYLVVDGFLEAGPGENRGDHATRDGSDTFTLSDQDLGLLREDAARMYSAAVEVGWWRTLPDPGQFGPRDFATQGELVGPGGVGLLVFGSGVGWGTAYLGPEGLVPGSARSFIPVPRPAPDAPTRELVPVPAAPEAAADLEPEPATEPVPGLELEPVTAVVAAPSQAIQPLRRPPQAGPSHYSPVPVPRRDMGIKPSNPSYVGPKLPTDVKIVIVALVIAIIVAAVIIGKLSSSLLVAVIVAVVALLVALGVIVFSRI